MAATTDEVGTMVPTDQRASERVCAEDIGTQLINIDSVQQTIREHVSELESSGMEASVSELKSLLPKLDSLQASLRKTFNAHARPLIRSLYISDMPIEILRKIFEDVRGDFDDRANEYPIYGIRAIQSLRLTCRRFCDASSPMLLHQLDVSLTASSLAHLDEVSRHPTISKGIRSLQIRVALYDDVPARSLQSFIGEIVERLRGDLVEDANSIRDQFGSFDWDGRFVASRYGDYTQLSEIIDNMGKRNEALRSCTDYLRPETSWPDDNKTMAALSQVYEDYWQLVEDQCLFMHNDTFASSVAEAVARVPTIARLSVTDLPGFKSPTLWTRISSPIYSSVRENVLTPRPFTAQMTPRLGRQLVILLRQLLLAVFRAGKPLTGLRIYLWSDIDLKMDLSEEQVRDMTSGIAHLQELNVYCQVAGQTAPNQHPSGESIGGTRLTSLLFKGKKLRSVSLCPGPLSGDVGWGVEQSIALLPWATLKKIRLVYSHIQFDELNKYLQKLTPGTCIILEEIRLLSGLWADLLDVIRAKADCHSNVISPAGCNAAEMDDGFHETFLSWDGEPSAATAYIRGQIMNNPLRSLPIRTWMI